MLLHVADAIKEGFQKIPLCCLTVAAAVTTDLALWLAFKMGKEVRYIPAHEITASLGADKSKAIFHAYTIVIWCNRKEKGMRYLENI